MKEQTALSIWISRALSPITALVLAFYASANEAWNAPMRDAFSDFCTCFYRTFKVCFLGRWYLGAGWYHWVNDRGGNGRARWFWRVPKHPNWEPSFRYIFGSVFGAQLERIFLTGNRITK